MGVGMTLRGAIPYIDHRDAKGKKLLSLCLSYVMYDSTLGRDKGIPFECLRFEVNDGACRIMYAGCLERLNLRSLCMTFLDCLALTF